MISRAVAIALLALLAGCGGGGSSGSAQPPQALSPMGSATLVISFPAPTSSGSGFARGPRYVSTNSAAVKVTINSINGNATLPPYVTPNPFTAQLMATGASPNCTVSAGTETCTVNNVPAPVGSNVSYTIAVLDSSNRVLSEVTVLENVLQGVVSNFNIALNGVVGALVLQNLPASALTAGVPSASQTFADVVRVNDPSGARIVGPDAFDAGKTVTVTDNDTSGQTSLAGHPAAICSGALTCTLSHGSDTVDLVYTGRAVAPSPTDSFSVSAASSGVTTASMTVTINDSPIVVTGPISTDTTGDGNIDNGSPTIFFTSLSGSATFTASELGWSNSPYNQFFGHNESTNGGSGVGSKKSCAGIATVTPASGTAVTYTVTPVGPGVCTVTITDGVGQASTLYVSVTGSQIIVNGKHREPQ
ncbi:MAG: hypothetical protein M3169_10515 [Candidatus Eremiobacteraeota bacterium]|nr:hypothetical protein [Candidatus Eremiobacteraeota bacterium]